MNGITYAHRVNLKVTTEKPLHYQAQVSNLRQSSREPGTSAGAGPSHQSEPDLTSSEAGPSQRPPREQTQTTSGIAEQPPQTPSNLWKCQVTSGVTGTVVSTPP